jgi:hypothetical protein
MSRKAKKQAHSWPKKGFGVGLQSKTPPLARWCFSEPKGSRLNGFEENIQAYYNK